MNILEQKQQELAEAKAAVERIEKEINVLATNGQWVPGFGEPFWYVDSTGNNNAAVWGGLAVARYRLAVGNVFRVGDKQGPKDYIKFMLSIRRTCTYEEANWCVGHDGHVYKGKSHMIYLLGRCKPTKDECEQWRDEYHEFQMGLCEEPSE